MNVKKKTISMIVVLAASLPIFGASYNIKDFGAKGDGINLDSKAVNDAIESASANGGCSCRTISLRLYRFEE